MARQKSPNYINILTQNNFNNKTHTHTHTHTHTYAYIHMYLQLYLAAGAYHSLIESTTPGIFFETRGKRKRKISQSNYTMVSTEH